MKPTVRDIAKKAEVSIASVSLVLNDKPSRITEATKQKILQAARELGYDFEEKQRREEKSIQDESIQEQCVAKKLHHSLIGVIRPRYCSEFLEACQKGIDQYARVYGYRTILCTADNSTEQALDCVKTLTDIRAAGIIMMPPMDMNEHNNNERLGAALKAAKVPFLLLNQAIDRVFCDFVTGDNKSGGYIAAEYLIHKGHSAIGMIVGNRDVYTCRKRIEGYKEALAFYNISINEDYIFYGQYKPESGYEGMKYLDNLGVHAVLTYDDEIACGVYRYAREKGMMIGQDISVVGFNDSSVDTMLLPTLTSVSQPGELMGKKACEIIVKRITGEDRDAVRTTYFTPVLIERESVKCLNEGEEPQLFE